MAQSTPQRTKAGRPARPTAVKDAQVRRIRAMGMIQQRIHAVPLAQIATNFNVSLDTVERELQWAKKNHLLEVAEDRLLGTLLTKAMTVIEAALDDGDLDAAKTVITVFNNASHQKAKREEKQESREFDLEDYFKEKRLAAIDVGAVPVPQGPPRALLPDSDGRAPASSPAVPAGEASPDPVEDQHDPDPDL